MSLNTKIRGVQLNDAIAGNGLEKDGSENLQLDLKLSAGLKIDTGELSIEPADFAGIGLKDDGSDNLELDLSELSAVVIDVSADEVAFIDATDGTTKKEAVADIVTAMAGSGLTATNGVLSADAVADNIIESDISKEDESANCDGVTVAFTLSNTPVTNSVQVFLNGLLQQEGSGKDYTLSGTTVTFATAPIINDLLIIYFIINN